MIPPSVYAAGMDRTDYVLGVLVAAQGALTPVQVQKLFFILDQDAALMLHGPYFKFKPYYYGPFDSDVYQELDRLQERGLIAVNKNGIARKYEMSSRGIFEGLRTFSNLPPRAQDYIRKLTDWIRALSFAQLVLAVHQKWPSMKLPATRV